MTHRNWILLLVGILFVASSARAGTLGASKITLHLQEHSNSKTCTSLAPVDAPCSAFVTAGRTGRAYDVYLIVADGPEAEGIAGVSCGIDYYAPEGRGVDVLQWTRCSDLEFSSGWPEPRSGNRMTWAAQTNCQRRVVGGEGVQAIAGALYVYAYEADRLTVLPNYAVYPVEFAVADCRAVEAALPNGARGSVRFTPEGAEQGSNPCLGEAPPPLPNPPPQPPPPPDPAVPPGPPPCFPPPTVLYGTQLNAKVLLHVQDHATNWNAACAAAPATACTGFVTGGEGGAGYDVYLLVARAEAEAGVAGLSFGIVFDGKVGSGVDVMAWTHCADQEVPVTWPWNGGGNRITWSPQTNCQRDVIAGDGVHAVAGVFYVYAYSTDILAITAHPQSRRLTVVDCAGVETDLPCQAAGTARFRSGRSGYGRGWNPCLDKLPEPPPPPPPPVTTVGKVLLHIGEVVGAEAACDAIPWMAADVVTSAEAREDGSASYYVYILGTPHGQSPVGLTGFQLGIQYDNPSPGRGLAVSSWRRCSTLDFPMPDWPAGGSGNTITWALGQCQDRPLVSAGFFYVTAYTPATMAIAPYPVTDLVKIADCRGAEGKPEVVVGIGWTGWVSFGGAGRGPDTDGCNPALGPCADPVPVRQTTWGKIKAKYGG